MQLSIAYGFSDCTFFSLAVALFFQIGSFICTADTLCGQAFMGTNLSVYLPCWVVPRIQQRSTVRNTASTARVLSVPADIACFSVVLLLRAGGALHGSILEISSLDLNAILPLCGDPWSLLQLWPFLSPSSLS